MNSLTIGSIISNGFSLGFKHLVSIVGALILWGLTLWIPYINVGTTIALVAIVPSISKGEPLSPTDIFNKEYRQYMGEFFLTVSFIFLGTMIGYVFLVIPGIVISTAWCLALYLMVDRDHSPIEALKNSNRLTYGKKWTIFLGIIILSIILGGIAFVLSFVGGMISELVGIILSVIAYLVFIPIQFGAYAHIYNQLAEEGEEAEAAV